MKYILTLTLVFSSYSALAGQTTVESHTECAAMNNSREKVIKQDIKKKTDPGITKQ